MTGRVVAIAQSVFADAVRRKTLYVVLVFAVIMLATVPSLPSYGIGVVQAVFREVSLALIFLAALVLALALMVNRIPSDAERRTVYNVLAKNVRRWEYVLGTWLGVFLFLGTAIACFTLVTQAVALFTYHDPMFLLWQGAFAIWLEMGVLASFATAWSARFGPVPTAVASLAFLFIAHARAGLLAAGVSPAIRFVYPSLDTLNIINPVAHGHGVSTGYQLIMLTFALAYVAVLLLIGSMIFANRDL
jgi:ABC-type transport system involved in multi-copper enzyme maturation permease subunit